MSWRQQEMRCYEHMISESNSYSVTGAVVLPSSPAVCNNARRRSRNCSSRFCFCLSIAVELSTPTSVLSPVVLLVRDFLYSYDTPLAKAIPMIINSPINFRHITRHPPALLNKLPLIAFSMAPGSFLRTGSDILSIFSCKISFCLFNFLSAFSACFFRSRKILAFSDSLMFS